MSSPSISLAIGPARVLIWALLLALLPLPDTTAAAEGSEKPLWELGLMAGGGLLPDYPAAAQNHFQWLALPYLAYRGKFLRSDKKGLLRGRFFKSDRVELDVSLKGSFPADSGDNEARRGMPDLDWLGEIGPRLQITLAKAARDAKVELELPLRAVFSTDFSSFDTRGAVFAPELAYQHERLFDFAEFKLSLGASYGTEKLAEYFYEVSDRYATATRAAYQAESGYIGSTLKLVMFKPLNRRWRLFAGLGADFHHGSANEQSPLYRDKTTMSVGFGFIWSALQSKQMVRE
ncbi:MAG: MipA/OmpV family protein [Alphaproteobacteria bacterium]|jgi:outer membrane scaffolding protein for murein synthesis (MipA/OmpV family)|nr:MipA/OmpV family protein [Alphaproteobacteria bacterium]HJP23600.1 MipA/OmpV family protein [Alphaproteobacteria bacterium]